MATRRLESMGLRRTSETEPAARILYVEDDDANWRITERYLRGKFYLRRARDSAEAFAVIRREKFDLILLDIELTDSEFDGIQICRILKGKASLAPLGPGLQEEVRETPVVFVTAYTARYPKEQLLEVGADEVVTKPVDYTRLLLVASRLIVRRVHSEPPLGS